MGWRGDHVVERFLLLKEDRKQEKDAGTRDQRQSLKAHCR
jgi:hypothetical protein